MTERRGAPRLAACGAGLALVLLAVGCTYDSGIDVSSENPEGAVDVEPAIIQAEEDADPPGQAETLQGAYDDDAGGVEVDVEF